MAEQAPHMMLEKVAEESTRFIQIMRLQGVEELVILETTSQYDEIELSKVSILRDAVLTYLARRQSVIVGLDRVRYIDSIGLGSLIEVDKKADKTGLFFAIAVSNPSIRRPLNITGLFSTLNIYKNQDEAILAYQKRMSSD